MVRDIDLVPYNAHPEYTIYTHAAPSTTAKSCLYLRASSLNENCTSITTYFICAIASSLVLFKSVSRPSSWKFETYL